MRIASFQQKLLAWYQLHHRRLPWRNTKNPYRIWVSEVMLQQTQVSTVIPYYRRFLKKFPTPRRLAAAPLSEVLKAWEGLGYYARARNLHLAARTLMRKHGGRLPVDYIHWKALPGIGDYTAAAIASIQFSEPVPVLDGNAQRVLARWIALRDEITWSSSAKTLRAAAERLLFREDPGNWNQAVMELGARICSPRNPLCNECPAAGFCAAFRLKLTELIPVRKARRPIPHYQVVAAIIEKDGRILIARRHPKGLLGGLWEFPGGKQEAGESLQNALKRELQEEMDITIRVRNKICEIDHSYSHFGITLHAFRCTLLRGTPKAIGCAQWRWIKPQHLPRHAFPRADLKIIEKLAHLPASD